MFGLSSSMLEMVIVGVAILSVPVVGIVCLINLLTSKGAWTCFTQGEMVEERTSGKWIFIVLAILLLTLVLFSLELPSFGSITTRPHAVQKHGQDAITARTSLTDCKNLKSQICPKSSLHGLTVVFWCETGSTLCPGMYATIGGKEKSAFIRPCYQWRECQW